MTEQRTQSSADVVVVSIIPNERTAIFGEFAHRWPGARRVELAGNTFVYTVTTKKGWKVKVAVRAIVEAGNISSAIETTNLLSRFYPRFAFLCGIAGNINHEKRKLGDVIVSGGYDYRAYTRMSQGGHLAHTHPRKPDISRAMLSKATDFFGSVSVDFSGGDLSRFLGGQELPHPPKIEVGKIFCWDLVLDDDDFRKKLVEADREYRAVEMETFGFLRAIEAFRDLREHPIDGLIFRGLSDPASGKGGSDAGAIEWRPISARNAARAMVAFIDNLGEGDCIAKGF